MAQSAEKTEGGTSNLQVDQEHADAQTFVSGGDLSWAAAKWATGATLEVWLQLAADAYAKASERAAAEALVAAVSATGSVASDDAAGWFEAILTEAANIQVASDDRCDVLYCDALSAAHVSALVFAQGPTGTSSIAGIEIISSSGLAPGPTVILGASRALFAAESPGAPVQLRAVEPAIGGIEVGLIGSFAAAVADPLAFVSLSP